MRIYGRERDVCRPVGAESLPHRRAAPGRTAAREGDRRASAAEPAAGLEAPAGAEGRGPRRRGGAGPAAPVRLASGAAAAAARVARALPQLVGRAFRWNGRARRGAEAEGEVP